MVALRTSLAPSTPAAILRLQIDHHITMQSIHCAQKPGLSTNMLNIKMPIVALPHTLSKSPLRRITIRQSIKDKPHRLAGSHQPLCRRINPNPHPRLIKKRAVPLRKILRINPAELRGCLLPSCGRHKRKYDENPKIMLHNTQRYTITASWQRRWNF